MQEENMGRWQKQISKTFVDKKECNSIWLFVYWATEHIELVDNMNQHKMINIYYH